MERIITSVTQQHVFLPVTTATCVTVVHTNLKQEEYHSVVESDSSHSHQATCMPSRTRSYMFDRSTYQTDSLKQNKNLKIHTQNTLKFLLSQTKLTLCIWRTLTTVKTLMQCSIMLHFIRVYTVCKGKKIFRQNTIVFFLIITWHPYRRKNSLVCKWLIIHWIQRVLTDFMYLDNFLWKHTFWLCKRNVSVFDRKIWK